MWKLRYGMTGNLLHAQTTDARDELVMYVA